MHIIESAKERAYRKVNEKLILMYRDIGEYISVQSENAEYGDAFVQKLADFFATNYPELKGFNRRGLYRMKQFYELYKDNEKVSTLLTQQTVDKAGAGDNLQHHFSIKNNFSFISRKIV